MPRRLGILETMTRQVAATGNSSSIRGWAAGIVFGSPRYQSGFSLSLFARGSGLRAGGVLPVLHALRRRLPCGQSLMVPL